MPKTLEKSTLENKMERAIEFTFEFYKENNRFPKTSEDPYYRSAIRYFKGARNYREQALMRNGLSKDEAVYELDKKSQTREEVFNEALELYKKEGILWYGSDLVEDYFGCLYYIRKAILEELGYSKEDILYEIKAQNMKTSIPLEEVIAPLEDYIKSSGEVPRSSDLEERGNIIRRFERWETAVEVALEHIENPEISVEELYTKLRSPYLPNVETLEPIKDFIVKYDRLPKATEISNYRRIAREYILWDNALDEAMGDLRYSIEKRMELFRNR